MSSLQKPKGEFRQYIHWEGRWCHVYIVSTHYQTTLLGEDEKMVSSAYRRNLKRHIWHRDTCSSNKNRKNNVILVKSLDNVQQ